MLTEFQRRAAEAVSAAIRKLGGEIRFRDDGVHETVWLGEASCSRGAVRVYLYEDDYGVDFDVGETHRVFERPDFESLDAMLGAFCESLQVEMALGPYSFFAGPLMGELTEAE